MWTTSVDIFGRFYFVHFFSTKIQSRGYLNWMQLIKTVVCFVAKNVFFTFDYWIKQLYYFNILLNFVWFCEFSPNHEKFSYISVKFSHFFVKVSKRTHTRHKNFLYSVCFLLFNYSVYCVLHLIFLFKFLSAINFDLKFAISIYFCCTLHWKNKICRFEYIEFQLRNE